MNLNCKKCNEPLLGNYCYNCGRPTTLKRIDRQYLIDEIADFLLANRGMIYTIKKVLIKPGESVRDFISEDRYRFVKPVTFLIITSLIYTLVNHFFHIGIKDIVSNADELEGYAAALFVNWIMENSGYWALILGFFMAFWIRLFFRKAGYNLYEIFILLCFVNGITMLFSTVAAILQGITHLKLIQTSGFIGIIYSIWAIGQFFDRKKAASYIKALLSYILVYFIISLLAAIATIIEIIIKS